MAENSLKKTKEEILKTPIKDLGLAINSSPLEELVKQLYQELGEAGIQFRPSAYLSDSWGCPDGVPIIGLPFFLADETLWLLDKEKQGTGEKDKITSNDKDEVRQILRHEAGHAFNYAHSLYKLPHWQEIFGTYEKPCEDNFAPVAGSDRFVKHLEGWYAQKHPDEDFAETFAVVITPGFDWKKIYKGTPAYEKLVYVSDLIKEYKDKPVPAFDSRLDVPVESINITVEDWYKQAASPRPRRKILILFYQEYPNKRPLRDEVVDQIKEVLLKLNYSAVLLPINRSIEKITSGIAQEKPDLVFNLCETFRDNDMFEFNITALLEMLKVPFTGSGSGSLFLSNDKFISKKIFDYHNVPFPKFFTVPLGTEPELPKNLSFPLFVKPIHEDASIGIDEKSVVTNEEDLKKKAQSIHQEIKDDVMVEEYIEGREFFVSVLGHNLIRALPVVELTFSNWPKSKPKIYTFNAKVEKESEEYKGTTLALPSDLPPEVVSKIQDFALRVFRALNALDYARIDFRMDKDGKIYVLESNLNPYLAKKSETAFAAQAAGLTFEQLIGKIVELALARADIHL